MQGSELPARGDEESPLVSICIPTYNRAGMVGDAIRSALAQTYRNIEVLVVDNASTDGTEAVVASFPDPRLNYIRNVRNLGLFGNCNRCIELARGKYLHILHSDDMIPPEFTATCVRFLEDHPEVAFTFTGAEIETGRAVTIQDYLDRTMIFPLPEGFRRILRDRSVVACPSVVSRREIFQKYGGFSLDYPYASDLALWLKISRKEAVAFISGTRIRYRQGSHSESHRLLFESPRGYLDMVRIYLAVREDLGADRTRYRDEMNAALERFSEDCLFAVLTRVEGMGGIRPAFLALLARTALSLAEGGPLRSRIRRGGIRAALFFLPGACRIPGFRRLGGWILRRRETLY